MALAAAAPDSSYSSDDSSRETIGPPPGTHASSAGTRPRGVDPHPSRTLPRTVRSGLQCSLSYAPHSKQIQLVHRMTGGRSRSRGSSLTRIQGSPDTRPHLRCLNRWPGRSANATPVRTRDRSPWRAPRETTYYAARKNGYTVRRAAPFVEKALALARDDPQGLGPPPATLPRGAGRRPSSDSPPDCAVWFGMSPILRTAP
jgi:hypothetical protein